jgi:ABC-type transport system involved in multi-copper enzyme maturation permease subunit
LAKEGRELFASRAYWLMLIIIGLLVGQGFITAVNLYGEASGIGGTAAALAQGLSPLDGILVPTFGAYDLAATLLFPLVAIRLLAAEKESGALKLVLQFPQRPATIIAVKVLVLLFGWILCWVPAVVALLLWKSYGGHLYAPETFNLLLGHGLRMLISTGVAFVAAALSESAASAAIVTLGFTLGTWALDFLAAGRGGWMQGLAAYTPAAVLRVFEQGQLRLSTVINITVLSLACLALAAVWLHTGRSLGQRLLGTCAVALVVTGVVALGSTVRHSWDLSEDRRNSFSRADESALKQIQKPLRVRVYLAAEDPRLMDLERNILNKLKRLLPRLDVEYAATSRAGLFEGAEDHYGEVWYELGEQKTMTLSTTEPIVLEELYKLAGIEAPEHPEESDYSGYPLAARPAGAAWIFYGLWPVSVGLAWFWIRGLRRS